MDVPASTIYAWKADSNILKEPAFLLEEDAAYGLIQRHHTVRTCWRSLGDSITTDHISPAGRIAPDNPAGQYLLDLGVDPDNFHFLRRAARQP